MNGQPPPDDSDDLDNDWEPEFSAKTAAAVRIVAQDVLDAFKQHVEVVCAAQNELAESTIDASAEVLRDALDRFVDAQSDHCGEWAPFYDAFEDEDDEDDDDDDEEGATATGAVTGISRLARWDFEVVDEAAVLRAGQAAWLETYPDTTADDLAKQEDNVGLALYNISHLRGQDAIFDTPGIHARWGFVATHQQPDLGPLEDEDLDEAFLVETPPLFSEGYLYTNEE